MTKIVFKKWETKTIDDNLLYRTAGVKETPSGNLRKCTERTINQSCNRVVIRTI